MIKFLTIINFIVKSIYDYYKDILLIYYFILIKIRIKITSNKLQF